MEAYYTECAAQKARREVKAKAKEKAEKQRIVEKKKKLEYIQWLWNEMLEEEATLLKRAKEFQVKESKHKKVTARNEKEQQSSKKTKEK